VNDHRHVPPQLQSRWTCDRVREELEGWALGALDAAENRAVGRHLAICPKCRSEGTAIRDIASLLPLSLAPVDPSATAKRNLMVRIAEEQMASAAISEPSGDAVPDMATMESAPRQRSYHWSQLLVAPLAIALVIMTLWSFELRGQVNDQGGGGGRSALTAPLPDGVQTFSMHTECAKCQSTGKLLADPKTAHALMVAWNLDPTQVHQVWCEEGDGSRVLVASLQVSEDGGVVQPLAFDQPISGYSRIYVMSRNGDKVEIKLGMTGSELASPSPDGSAHS
jgi:hypothetical protein